MNINEPLAGREKQCPVCRKEFFAGADWVYKRGYMDSKQVYICSWKCLNKWDEEKKNGSHKKKRTERDAAGEGDGAEIGLAGF